MLRFLFLCISVVGGSDITRDFYGDIFQMPECHNGSRCDNGGTRPALEIKGRPCYCQCAPTHLTYREDKQQCVKDIKECYMSIFYRPFTVEAIPLVYLPTSGQLVHPEAHLSLAGRRDLESAFPTCKAAVSQYLTAEGWRTLTRVDGGGPVFGLFNDNNKTFLQFLGNTQDRRILQQHLALVRLFCKVAQYSPFETCVAIRVGWVPGVDDDYDDEIPSNRANMMVIGLSIGILGLVYVFAVLIYLKIRRQQLAKRKNNGDQESCIEVREDDPDNVNGHKRVETSKRLELYHTNTLASSKAKDTWSQISSVVETYNRTWTDRMGQTGCEFRAQDFQLEPELFEPEHLASPPQQVLDYLERLQSSVTFARHRLRSCYRYQPTLIDIPEDDYFYQELKASSPAKDLRTTPDGGSASSMISEDKEISKKKNPKVPPRKPRRKSKTKNKADICHETLINSDQEQKDIQNAMNTLNETLDALEYDIFKHDMMHQMSDIDQTGPSCPNSTEGELDEFDLSSSCSSLSAVTVLGKETKKPVLTSSANKKTIEKNLSEEVGTFSNSIYSASSILKPAFMDPKYRFEEGFPSSSTSSEHSESSSQDSDESKQNTKNECLDPADSCKQLQSRNISTESNGQNTCQELNKKANSSKTLRNNRCSKLEKQHIMRTTSNDIRNTKHTDIDGKDNYSISKQNGDVSKPKKNILQTSSNTSTVMTGMKAHCSNTFHNGHASKHEKKHLMRTPSNESRTTTCTDMTVDSLDSTSDISSPGISLSPTPSLVDMWISKIVQNSKAVPYTKSRRKPKKLVVPENEIENWEHVCQKHKDPACPVHDLNDSEPNLIDKLAHYSSKTMANQNVAGYFQSLKQDVLKEHLKSWLVSNSQIKRHKNRISIRYRKKDHKTPLVKNGQFSKIVCDSGGILNQEYNDAVHDDSKESMCSLDKICEQDSLETQTAKIYGMITAVPTKVI